MGMLRDLIALQKLKLQTQVAQAQSNLARLRELNLQSPKLLTILRGLTGEEELSDPYQQVPVVKAAVRAKAINIAQVPWRITKLGSDTILESGAMYRLFEDINPYIDPPKFWEGIVTNMELGGDAPIMLDEQRMAGDIPVALWPVRYDKVKMATKGEVFVGWNAWLEGRRESIFVTKEDMIMPRYYSKKTMLRGDSPVDVLLTTLRAEWGAIRFNQVFFENDAMPGTIFSTEQDLTDEQYERMHEQLINARKGVNHAHEAMLLEGGVKIASTRPSHKDMQFLEGRKFTREDVAMVLKVPKTELTLYEDVNYATARSEDVGFWKKTLVPLMALIAGEINHILLNPRGYNGYFDIQAIDALNDEILDKAETSKIFFSMGVPFNIVNERLNLGFPEVQGGDEPWGGRAPMGQQLAGLTAEIVGEVEPQKLIEGPAAIAEMRAVQWEKIDKQVRPAQAQIAHDVREYFFDIEQKILKRIVKRIDKKYVMKAPAEDQFEYIRGLFIDEELREATEDGMDAAARAGWRSVGQEPLDEYVIQAINTRLTKISGINDTAAEGLITALRATIQQAIDQGWTEEQRANAIVDTVKDRMSMTKARAKMIARTEAHGAFNEGRHEAMAETKPKSKMWLTARDTRVRGNSPKDIADHASLDGVTIPFNEDFVMPGTGALMAYPLDPRGPAEEVINCRCTTIAIFD